MENFGISNSSLCSPLRGNTKHILNFHVDTYCRIEERNQASCLLRPQHEHRGADNVYSIDRRRTYRIRILDKSILVDVDVYGTAD